MTVPSTSPSVRPDLLDPTVVTWVDGRPRLVGGRCGSCDVVTFPAQSGCPRCGEEAMAPTPLAPRGTVWTWTTQEYEVKAPYAGPTGERWEPYVVAYVELAGEVRVEARLVDCPLDAVAIDMEVELTVVPFTQRPDGSVVHTFAFRPTRGAGA